MFRTPRFALAAFTLALSSGLAQAEDPRFGVQVHGNIPTGDLKDAVDSKLGVGAGAHVTFDLGSGHVIRPRLDYVFFPEATVSTIKNKVNSLSIGADYLYFLAEKPEGFYVTAGLGFHHWKVDATAAGVSVSDTSNKPGFSAGVGYNFNSTFGAEFRYLASKYGAGAKDITANALQFGVTLRF